MSVLAVAVAALIVVRANDPDPGPEATPAVEGISGWFTPRAPELLPGSPPAAPEISDRPYIPPDANPAGGPDGAVPPAPPRAGVAPSPAENATAYSTIQAENFAEQNGITIEAAESGPGRHIGFITTGDWVRYDTVGFTGTPATSLVISASNWAKDNGTGEVELRLDNRANAPAGVMTIPNNSSWFTFKTYTMRIQPITGVHHVYLTFTSHQKEEFANVDWIRFQH